MLDAGCARLGILPARGSREMRTPVGGQWGPENVSIYVEKFFGLQGKIQWHRREGEPRGPGMEAAGRPGLGRGQRQRPGCGAGWEVLGAPRDHGQDLCVGLLPTSQAQGLCGRGQWPPRSSPGPAHLPAPSPGSWRGSGPRAPYVAGSSAEASASGFGAFMWSGPLRTAGWKLVFHQNSQGLVSCLTHNWWFFLKC